MRAPARGGLRRRVAGINDRSLIESRVREFEGMALEARRKRLDQVGALEELMRRERKLWTIKVFIVSRRTKIRWFTKGSSGHAHPQPQTKGVKAQTLWLAQSRRHEVIHHSIIQNFHDHLFPNF